MISHLAHGRCSLLVFTVIIIEVLGLQPSHAGNYDYRSLRMKDRDVLTKDIAAILKPQPLLAGESRNRSQRESQKIEKRREALKMIFSRPNFDNLATSLISPIRAELKAYNSYEEVLISLVGEAIYTLKESKRKTKYQISMLFLLENIMAEIQPNRLKNKEYQKMLIRVRKANIKLSKKIIHELKFKLMIRAISPSVTAKNILKPAK